MRGEIVRNANGAVGIVTGLGPNGRDVRVRTSNGSSPVWSRFSIVHHDGADYATATDMILNGLVVEGADMAVAVVRRCATDPDRLATVRRVHMSYMLI